MPLKYLFKATFANGFVYQQNAADKSVIEPEKRSCFTDVRKQVESGNALLRFELVSGDQSYAVDLTDGHFEHNGVAFAVSDGINPNEPQELAGAKRDIVFWRRHTHEFRLSDGEELGHGVRYDLGWQANVAGKNYQRLIHFT
jgi:hypothetical protein